jgi:hypothetical protein
VKAAREVAFEAADRFALGLALGLLSREVGAGFGVQASARDRDDVQRVI